MPDNVLSGGIPSANAAAIYPLAGISKEPGANTFKPVCNKMAL